MIKAKQDMTLDLLARHDIVDMFDGIYCDDYIQKISFRAQDEIKAEIVPTITHFRDTCVDLEFNINGEILRSVGVEKSLLEEIK